MFIIFSLIYGIIHGFSPGHGKLMLLSKSFNYNYKRGQLLTFGCYIVYMQGLMSFFLIKYFKYLKSSHLMTNIRNFDMGSLKVYGLLLIIVEVISYFNNILFLKKNYRYSIFLTGLLPCAGILNILCVITFFNCDNLIFITTLSISTGIFFTIAWTIYLGDTINKKFKHLYIMKKIISYINSIIIIIIAIAIIFLSI